MSEPDENEIPEIEDEQERIKNSIALLNMGIYRLIYENQIDPFKRKKKWFFGVTNEWTGDIYNKKLFETFKQVLLMFGIDKISKDKIGKFDTEHFKMHDQSHTHDIQSWDAIRKAIQTLIVNQTNLDIFFTTEQFNTIIENYIVKVEALKIKIDEEYQNFKNRENIIIEEKEKKIEEKEDYYDQSDENSKSSRKALEKIGKEFKQKFTANIAKLRSTGSLFNNDKNYRYLEYYNKDFNNLNQDLINELVGLLKKDLSDSAFVSSGEIALNEQRIEAAAAAAEVDEGGGKKRRRNIKRTAKKKKRTFKKNTFKKSSTKPRKYF
jgi:hypothetical protein